MLQSRTTRPDGGPFAGFAAAAPGVLSTMVYHSRAARPLSGPDLRQLARQAQARNRTESITGLMLYDKAHFFQWLEGPSDGLARVMRSIHADPRHRRIEVLNDEPIAERCFGDWNMKLATSGRLEAEWQREVIRPPRTMIEELRRDPDSAPKLLATLAPLMAVSPRTGDVAADAFQRAPAGDRLTSILRTLIVTTVVPELAARRGLTRDIMPPADARPRELARLLIAADHRAVLAFIDDVRGTRHPLRLYATLFEPAARHLGDLFREDRCGEFDVTLGLCQLQTAIRAQGAGRPPLSRGIALSAPSVLVAPEPGEIHGLSAMLDSEALWNAGWAPRREYPAGDEALQEMLAATWFDALDLSLSAAFRRDHWLARVAATIAGARRASRNPALAIVVGGRIFAEQRDAFRRVGADRAIPTALSTEREVLGAVVDRQDRAHSRLH